MIKKYLQLDRELINKVKVLLQHCEAYDAAEIPIQLDHSLNYFSDMPSWYFYFDQDNLISLISVFNPLKETAELTGCTLPEMRSRGIFKELVTGCIEELKINKIKTLLFPIDSSSKAGIEIALKLNLIHDHAEYVMQCSQYPDEYICPVQIRKASFKDLESVAKINATLFHESPDESKSNILNCLESKDRELFVAETGKLDIGICTLFYTEKKVTVYGLGITQIYQGKGYGEALLMAMIAMHKEKKIVVELEVDSSNNKAINLYKKAGFKESKIIRYYQLPI